MPNAEMSKKRNHLESIEIELLLEGVFRYYGFDFRNYAPASLKRRIWNSIRSERLTTVSGLQERVMHDPACMERFLLNMSVNVTAMFRDPSFYLAFRSDVEIPSSCSRCCASGCIANGVPQAEPGKWRSQAEPGNEGGRERGDAQMPNAEMSKKRNHLESIEIELLLEFQILRFREAGA